MSGKKINHYLLSMNHIETLDTTTHWSRTVCLFTNIQFPFSSPRTHTQTLYCTVHPSLTTYTRTLQSCMYPFSVHHRLPRDSPYDAQVGWMGIATSGRSRWNHWCDRFLPHSSVLAETRQRMRATGAPERNNPVVAGVVVEGNVIGEKKGAHVHRPNQMYS